jgi:hypothetical protein
MEAINKIRSAVEQRLLGLVPVGRPVFVNLPGHDLGLTITGQCTFPELPPALSCGSGRLIAIRRLLLINSSREPGSRSISHFVQTANPCVDRGGRSTMRVLCKPWAATLVRVCQPLLGPCDRAFLCLPAFQYNLLTVRSCPMLTYQYVVFVRFESYSRPRSASCIRI